jgi:hypothetical protein
MPHEQGKIIFKALLSVCHNERIGEATVGPVPCANGCGDVSPRTKKDYPYNRRADG